MKRFKITLLVAFVLLAIGAETGIRLTTQVVDQVTSGQVFGRDWNSGTGSPIFFNPTPFSIGAFSDLVAGRTAFILATGTTTTNYGDTFAATGTATNVVASATLPSYAQWATTTVDNNVANVTGNANYVVGRSIRYFEFAGSSTAVNRRDWLSLSDQSAATMGASDNPAGNYVGIHFCNDGASAGCASDLTNYELCTKDNVTQHCEDTGVAADTAFHAWAIIETPGIDFKLYECATLPCPNNLWTLRATNSVNLPITGTVLSYRRTTTCETCNPTVQGLRLARMQIVTTF